MSDPGSRADPVADGAASAAFPNRTAVYESSP
jgi:hypothetical protein